MVSGGRLVVEDARGRGGKAFGLARGLATLGRAPHCDIRVMLPAVRPTHATLVVHKRQTVVRNVGDGETLVNGRGVSVAALRHGDVISVGGRRLRWEYSRPELVARARSPAPELPPRGAAPPRARRATLAGAPPARRPRSLELALELRRRDTAPPAPPAPPAPRQVAVVQPQRRERAAEKSPAPSRRARSEAEAEESRGSLQQGHTQATLWIEARKAAPRRPHSAPRRARRLDAPPPLDRTKQAAIMLMTGRTPKSKPSPDEKSPSYAAKKPSPVRGTPARARPSAAGSLALTLSTGDGSFGRTPASRGKRKADESDARSVTILEIADSTRDSTMDESSRAGGSAANPRKSALKDRSRRGSRKTESIKFDLGDPGGATSARPSPSARRPLRSVSQASAYGSARPLEAYSLVDLVSLDSSGSLYASAASGAPPPGCSTPYAARAAPVAARPPRASRARSRAAAGPSPEGASPRSSRRPGALTPEHRTAPDETGTPMLSIQSLLDSSRSSLVSRGSFGKVDRERGALGASSAGKDGRYARGHRSLERSVRRTQLRLSAEAAGEPEEVVTPKRAHELVPEDVKNKHSSAKKPLSKRSIIDDLNRSDFVKQLFNSPVKRKLSQSMTEFSRKQLFDDEEDTEAKGVSPLQKRHTVAVAGTAGTLEESLLERFVSPIAGPERSPDVDPDFTGVDRLFERNSPKNDLRDVKGVKALLRTPRTRKSVRNDLTDVRGVKALYARSPRNRLSDVRVKEAFAASPNNGLRRVTGVRDLFLDRSPANDLSDVRGVKRLFDRRSPENDLTDVRGVKTLWKRRSPENDLRNVSGAKRTLRNASPRNDLTDVRGVKRTFRRHGSEAGYDDVSGVARLFDDSDASADRAELLFDRLVGKPPVRAVYSKTFSGAPRPRRWARAGRSLRRSIDDITDGPEQWLRRELHTRLSGAGRELRMLATDTLQGGAPLLASRTRAASAAYEAHTLPLKKRSLAERSAAGRAAPGLPLKKRAVVHSTPVRGRAPADMSACDLGRVSPIRALDASDTRSTRPVTEDGAAAPVKGRTPRKQETPKKIDISKPYVGKFDAESPPKRSTRNRTKANVSQTNTKKRRSSIVVVKRAPVLSPKPTSRGGDRAGAEASPEPTRAARSKRAEKIETPKRTQTRATRTTVVVTKPSPKFKPVSDKKTKPKRGGTRVPAVETKRPSPQKAARSTRAAADDNKPKARGKKAQVEVRPTPKRGRKPAQVEEPAPLKPTRNNKTVQVAVETKTRGKTVTKAKQSSEEKPTRTRNKKLETVPSVESAPPSRGRRANLTKPAEEVKQSKTRGKKDVSSENKVAPARSTRGKKVEMQSSIQSEPSSRSRRNKTVEMVAPNERKRKATTVEEIPSKVAKVEPKRGRKAEAPKPIAKPKRGAAKDNKKDPNSNQEMTKSTRGARNKQNVESKKSPTKKTVAKPVEIEVKATRGRKVAQPKEPNIAPTARGKRKANTEPSPAKESPKKLATRKANTAARSTRRNANTEVPEPATGRSRRR